MTCPTIEELELYATSRLEGQALVGLEAHIAVCPNCPERISDVRRGLGLARRLAGFAHSEETAGETATTPAAPTSPTDSGAGAFPADSFAGYQIVREIHRGGQGVVYQAIHKTTKRKVAVKVMREGPFAGPSDKARFEREIQVLGQLDHPHIVAVHDTGVAAGCHYFVMDYVSGQPLDVFMASRQPSVPDTLKLFGTICEAVSNAHVKGVIHRDLKPGNIRIDAEGQPHILDFGLAKVATPLSSPRSQEGDWGGLPMTITGQFVGSLPWASPEQAEGNPGKIDIRTDVYSLGVILYQMLTGCFPYDVIGNMRDVLDRILKAEPTRPRSIRRQIDDEVETIVLKCLAKERERRYQSAGELARDVGHYLAGEPIEAKRDSLPYMLRKQLRRYRLPIAVAAGYVVLTTLGLITSVAFWQRAERERTTAEDQRRTAEAERAKANDFSSLLEDMLGSSTDPFDRKSETVTVGDLLEGFAAQSPAYERASPEVRVRVHEILGNALVNYNQSDAAVAHFERALELRKRAERPNDRATANTLQNLARAYANRNKEGDGDRAEKGYREALSIRRRVAGPPDAELARNLNQLGSHLNRLGKRVEGEGLLREALEVYRVVLGEDDPELADVYNNLGLCLLDQDRLAEAEPLLRKALEIKGRRRPDHPHVPKMMHNLAKLLTQIERYAEAESLLDEAIRLKRKLGSRDASLAKSLYEFARLRCRQERKADAELLAREALDIQTSVGPAAGEDAKKTTTFLEKLNAGECS